MVKDFIEMEREARNMMIVWIALYIAAVAMLFVSGEGISEYAMLNIPLLSHEGFIKIDSILLMLTLVGMVFIIGPIFVIDSITEYARRRTS
jgi:hypothetical protein